MDMAIIKILAVLLHCIIIVFVRENPIILRDLTQECRKNL